MPLAAEQEKILEQLVDDLEFEKEQLSILRDELVNREPDGAEYIRTLEAHIAAMQVEITETIERIYANHPDLVMDIRTAENVVEQKLRQIKNFCHNLPREVLEKGASFSRGKFSVRVAKTEFTTVYDSERIVASLPHLEEMYLDGAPVVSKTIAPEVIERLIAQGKLSSEEIAPYKNEIKVRNPNTVIQESE